VDRLARRLGVTLGLFHWRFAGLPALLEAVLADWRDTDSVAVLAALEGAGSPRRRFQDLMRVSIEQAGDSPAYDRAVRKWWRTDPAVPATVTEVDERRLAAFETLFRDAGYPPREALPRARISCCDQVGYDALGVQEPREQRWPLGATCRRILTGREGPRPTIQHRVDDDADGAVASPEAQGERALSDGSAEHARRLYACALVWDNTFPFGPSCGSEAAHGATLGRMRAAG
jgi:AcrR family transcriptional regulator